MKTYVIFHTKPLNHTFILYFRSNRLLVLGYSVVKRLKWEVRDQGWKMGDRCESIDILGVGGMTGPRLWLYVDHIKTTQPTVVFLHIGTNYLSAPSCDPLTLAQDIVDVARWFNDCKSVRHVSISEMLRRNDNRRANFNVARMETILDIRRLVSFNYLYFIFYFTRVRNNVTQNIVNK